MKQIIAAVDFSDASAQALMEAERISRWEGARLAVMHIIDARILEDLDDRMPLDQGQLVEQRRERLEAFVHRTIGSNPELRQHAFVGHPFGELVKAVNDFDADLLVMGAHGAGRGPQRVGSTAARCLRKAPADVLIVREGHDDGKPFRKVLACVDFSETSRRAAAAASYIAGHDGAPVEFVNIHHPLPMRFPVEEYVWGESPVPTEGQMVAAAELNLEKFVAPLVADTPELKHSMVVKSRPSVSHGIVDYANESGAELLVVGTRGRTGLKILLLGTIAEKVIHGCTCSVLAVKPEGFHYGHGSWRQ